jgi:NAD(P)-dependent dehydrogenase (short-subunit alcohol dehydrogenase family)
MVGLAIPGMSNYITSKMGIIGFMRDLANDVADDGITANAVLPGLTNTPASALLTEEQRRDTWGHQAIKRLTEPFSVIFYKLPPTPKVICFYLRFLFCALIFTRLRAFSFWTHF